MFQTVCPGSDDETSPSVSISIVFTLIWPVISWLSMDLNCILTELRIGEF